MDAWSLLLSFCCRKNVSLFQAHYVECNFFQLACKLVKCRSYMASSRIWIIYLIINHNKSVNVNPNISRWKMNCGDLRMVGSSIPRELLCSAVRRSFIYYESRCSHFVERIFSDSCVYNRGSSFPQFCRKKGWIVSVLLRFSLCPTRAKSEEENFNIKNMNVKTQ